MMRGQGCFDACLRKGQKPYLERLLAGQRRARKFYSNYVVYAWHSRGRERE